MEDRGRRAALAPIAVMRPLNDIKCHEAAQAEIERGPTGEIVAARDDAPVLREYRRRQTRRSHGSRRVAFESASGGSPSLTRVAANSALNSLPRFVKTRCNAPPRPAEPAARRPGAPPFPSGDPHRKPAAAQRVRDLAVLGSLAGGALAVRE